ncbi:hypothetical protein EMIT0P43_120155 [Pseudomonas jessenii]
MDGPALTRLSEPLWRGGLPPLGGEAALCDLTVETWIYDLRLLRSRTGGPTSPSPHRVRFVSLADFCR